MASRTKQPAVESQRTDVETMRIRHAGRAAQRLAELRGFKSRELVKLALDKAHQELAEQTGLPIEEVRELLKAGRKPADLLSLVPNTRR